MKNIFTKRNIIILIGVCILITITIILILLLNKPDNKKDVNTTNESENTGIVSTSKSYDDVNVSVSPNKDDNYLQQSSLQTPVTSLPTDAISTTKTPATSTPTAKATSTFASTASVSAAVPFTTPTITVTASSIPKNTIHATSTPVITPSLVSTATVSMPKTSPTTVPAYTADNSSTSVPNYKPGSESMTEVHAKEIAEELICKYHQYSFLGVCCDVEYVWADMSEFLTPAQKIDYYSSQYRITCCCSVSEAKDHILKTIDKSITGNFSADNFFYDDQKNLYALVIPCGVSGYGNISIIEYSSKKIVAKVAIDDIDGYTGVDDIFVIEKDNDDFVITGINVG